MNEGLADLYSSMRQVGGQFVVGYADPGRIAILREEKWVPLEQVLAADRDSQHYTENVRTRWKILRPELGADAHAELLARVSAQSH